MPHYPDTLTAHRMLPRNTLGHDYFVGDIHGQYSHLVAQLDAAGFNPKVDRLIATGDMIDRGEENIDVLAMLEHPWFYSVLGNHEIMLLEWLLGNAPHYYQMQVQNGGDWIAYVDENVLMEHAQLLVKKCPLAFTIDTPQGQVGICHTDPLNNDWRAMQSLSIDAFNAELGSLWSRQRYHHTRMDRPVARIANIDFVICGHVACEQPVWAANQVFIDTKFRGGALTVQTLTSLLPNA